MIIHSVANGEVKPIESIPDETFATKVMGEGVAIQPTDNWIFSPVDGKVTMIFETKHAIGVTANDGTEILIHVGVDTVNLHGEPFKTYIEVGDSVVQGELLMFSDHQLIEEKGLYSSIIVIIMNKKVEVDKTEEHVTKDDVILETIENKGGRNVK